MEGVDEDSHCSLAYRNLTGQKVANYTGGWNFSHFFVRRSRRGELQPNTNCPFEEPDVAWPLRGVPPVLRFRRLGSEGFHESPLSLWDGDGHPGLGRHCSRSRLGPTGCQAGRRQPSLRSLLPALRPRRFDPLRRLPPPPGQAAGLLPARPSASWPRASCRT